MPQPPRHVARIASRIKYVVGQVIQHEIKDPRLGFVTVLDVELTPDLREARIHVSVLGSAGEKSRTIHALEDARGYVQRRVGKNLEIRRTPLIHFVLDEPDDRVSRIEEILKRTREEETREEETREEETREEETREEETRE